jgi:hypothetical protein
MFNIKIDKAVIAHKKKIIYKIQIIYAIKSHKYVIKFEKESKRKKQKQFFEFLNF